MQQSQRRKLQYTIHNHGISYGPGRRHHLHLRPARVRGYKGPTNQHTTPLLHLPSRGRMSSRHRLGQTNSITNPNILLPPSPKKTSPSGSHFVTRSSFSGCEGMSKSVVCENGLRPRWSSIRIFNCNPSSIKALYNSFFFFHLRNLIQIKIFRAPIKRLTGVNLFQGLLKPC